MAEFTFQPDPLTPEAERREWRKKFEALGYRLRFKNPTDDECEKVYVYEPGFDHTRDDEAMWSDDADRIRSTYDRCCEWAAKKATA